MSEGEAQLLRRRAVPQIRDTLAQLKRRNMLPAIWFIFSRRGCDTAVGYAASEARLLSPAEQREVQQAIKTFQGQFPEAIRSNAIAGLLQGVAAHHAGCLPAWKSFVEELFQRGLVKVVFSTETLAAGINMPARTTVLSSLSKRGDNGQESISANSMLQMAGRAGRRGIDREGHVVVVQTPFEGAEECCKLLFAGPDPLVSQFTATYGMALNLLVGSRARLGVGPKLSEDADVEVSAEVAAAEGRRVRGRTMDEARALVEKSFGNYLGSEVVVQARQQLQTLTEEIESLEAEQARDLAFFQRLEERGAKDPEWQPYFKALAELKAQLVLIKKLHWRIHALRAARVEPALAAAVGETSHADVASEEGHVSMVMPCQRSHVTIGFADVRSSDYCVRHARLVARIGRPPFAVSQRNQTADSDGMIDDEEGDDLADDADVTSDMEDSARLASNALASVGTSSAGGTFGRVPDLAYYVAIGADNCWYVFTALAVRRVSRGEEGEAPEDAGWPAVRQAMEARLARPSSWRRIGSSLVDSIDGGVWTTEGGADTREWSTSIPMFADPKAQALVDYESALEGEESALEAELELARAQGREVRREVRASAAYAERRKWANRMRRRAKAKERREKMAERISTRLSRMQPTGWKEFVQVVGVLCQAGAVDPSSHELLPLGTIAAAVRGENELWLALAISDEALASLAPSELAGTFAALSSAGVKPRPGMILGSSMYSPSPRVCAFLQSLDTKRSWLMELQQREGVQMPLDLDMDFAGLVEAWACGVTWQQLMAGAPLDEGDVARLLRRTIDSLAQIPRLPHVDKTLAKSARAAANVMDRPPISELVG